VNPPLSSSTIIRARSIFETTIRYLGGFLSSYELSGYKHPILLEKAKEVADKMAYGWVGVRATFRLPCINLSFIANAEQCDSVRILAVQHQHTADRNRKSPSFSCSLLS
jgi:hypothetical protein